MSTLWSPLKNSMSKSLTISNFGNPVSKSWLRPPMTVLPSIVVQHYNYVPSSWEAALYLFNSASVSWEPGYDSPWRRQGGRGRRKSGPAEMWVGGEKLLTDLAPSDLTKHDRQPSLCCSMNQENTDHDLPVYEVSPRPKCLYISLSHPLPHPVFPMHVFSV